jgi:cell division transport system ATP-binding protein
VLDGQDVARLGRRQVPRMRRKIGIIFQDFKLLPNKSVWEKRRVRARGHGHAAAARSGRRSIACWPSSG